MRMPSLYNEKELEKTIRIQKKHAWDLEKDFDWKMDIDLSKPLVPLSKTDTLFPDATPKQKTVISQLLGLIVSETFNEFEMSMDKYKEECWTSILRKYPSNPEMWEMGEQFFEDERKHSEAFRRYTAKFSESVNVSPEELKSLLPQMENNKMAELFKIDAAAGGVALWWVAAAVEEESIRFFQDIKDFKDDIDPLFYQVHKLHFQEEARHACYAFLMLELIQKRAKTPVALALKKLDYLLSDVWQMTWTFSTLLNIRKVEKFKYRHEFFSTLCEVLPMLRQHSPVSLIHKMFTETPYISLILNPQENKHVKDAIEKSGSIALPRFKETNIDYTCEF